MIMKLNYYLRGLKLLEVSKKALVHDIDTFMQTNKQFSSLWLLDNTVHVLCRHAYIFSGRDPIIIIANSCSFDYVDFIYKIPLWYDVYCIDLPGCTLNRGSSKADTNNSNEYCSTQLNKIITLLGTEKYTLICETYGAGLIIESLVSKHLNIDKISRLVLINFEPQSIYFWTRMKISMLQIVMRNSWYSLFFAAFLFARPKALNRMKATYNLITKKETDELCIFNYTSSNNWYYLEGDIIHLSDEVETTLVESSQTGYSNAVSLSKRGDNKLKVSNFDLLRDAASKITVDYFLESIYTCSGSLHNENSRKKF